MKMSCLSGVLAALVAAAPVLAQTPSTSTDLAAAQAQIDALKQQLERLEATVDYLKANASAEHKDSAVAAANVATLEFSRGMWFGDVSYLWLNERNTLGNEGASSDATMAGIQLGIKPTFAAGTLTVAASYYHIANVRDRITKYSQTSTADPIT